MKLVYSQEAVADLARLRDFIANNDPSAAARIAADLIVRIDGLCAFPEMGRSVSQAPEPDSIRDFIFKTIKVVNRDENKGVLFASKADQSAHFNAHRSHYTQVLVAGLKYHFLEFVPSGEAFAKTIFGQAMNRAIAKAV